MTTDNTENMEPIQPNKKRHIPGSNILEIYSNHSTIGDLAPYWAQFLRVKGLPDDTALDTASHIGTDRAMSERLTDLILTGKKTATTSSGLAYEVLQEEKPKVGYYWLLLDWDGQPLAVLETTKVMRVLFSEVTWNMAKREGENEDLEGWQADHSKFFSAEGEDIGYKFTKDMPVVFEDFKIIFRYR